MRDPRYVFLIGAARSGTKFLRSVISSSSRCVAVPFDVNYVWRTPAPRYEHDAIPADCFDESSKRHVTRSLMKLSGYGKCQADTIVEKSVSNCLRVPFVNAGIPNGRYVHLIRDGRDVVESSYRQWLTPSSGGYMLKKLRYVPFRNLPYVAWYAGNLAKGLLSRRAVNIWGVQYPGIKDDVGKLGIHQICAKQWVECVRRCREDFREIPNGNVFEIRYEDLTRGSIRELCEFLELTDIDRVTDFFEETRLRDQQSRWMKTFDDQQRAEVMEIIQTELQTLEMVA